MIHIEEIQSDNSEIVIKVCGVLDIDSKEDLRKIFLHHLKNKKIILVDFTDIIHISREGRAFLKEFSGYVNIKEIDFQSGEQEGR